VEVPRSAQRSAQGIAPSALAIFSDMRRRRVMAAVGVWGLQATEDRTMCSFDAARLVLIDAEPVEIARQLRERAERTIRPKSNRH
jgi:hypothetical protein